MTELEAAKLIAEGKLPSPHKFGDMTLWALRATGTGAAYRNSLDEYVWRDPAHFLTDDFVARVGAGLPVVWEHPKVGSLDSKEFNDRVIGSTMLGFIRGQEVWCVARLYDAEAIQLMNDDQLSTSPGVVFRPGDGNMEGTAPDGTTILIEGLPSILDHLAVCEIGVWDKSGPATGVANGLLDETSKGAAAMAEDDKDKAAADAAKHDEALRRMDAKMDAFMDAFTKMDARFDAMEKEKNDARRHDAARKDKFGRRKDGESYKDWKGRHDADEKSMCDALRKDSEKSEEDCSMDAKRARHDAEEEEKRHDKDFEKWAKEEEKEPEHKDKKDAKEEEAPEDKKKEGEEEKAEKEEEKADAARKDSAMTKENAEMKLRLARLEGMLKTMTTETSVADRNALGLAQSRADSVAAMFGDRAPPPIPGETPLDYRKRMLKRFQKHSPTFAQTRFDGFDLSTVESVEDRVYADAHASAKKPGEASAGVLIPVVTREGGRDVTRFHGDIGAFMAPFVPQEMQLAQIRNPRRNGMN